MVRTGFVKEKKGDTLRVCFERPEACEGCRGCSKGLMPKKELLTVFGQAEVGDTVSVQMPEARTLRASLLAYAVPLCGLIVGLLIGAGLKKSDAVTLLLALAGLALGCLAARAVDLRLRKDTRWRPTVVEVLPAEKSEREKQ